MKVVSNKKFLFLLALPFLVPFLGAECSFRSFFIKRPLALLAASTTASFASGLAIPALAQAELTPRGMVCSFRDRMRSSSVVAAKWLISDIVRDISRETAEDIAKKATKSVDSSNLYWHLRGNSFYSFNDGNSNFTFNDQTNMGHNFFSCTQEFIDEMEKRKVLTFDNDGQSIGDITSTYWKKNNTGYNVKVGEVSDSWSCEDHIPKCWCLDEQHSELVALRSKVKNLEADKAESKKWFWQ